MGPDRGTIILVALVAAYLAFKVIRWVFRALRGKPAPQAPDDPTGGARAVDWGPTRIADVMLPDPPYGSGDGG